MVFLCARINLDVFTTARIKCLKRKETCEESRNKENGKFKAVFPDCHLLPIVILPVPFAKQHAKRNHIACLRMCPLIHLDVSLDVMEASSLYNAKLKLLLVL
jgi:hypothetical protein